MLFPWQPGVDLLQHLQEVCSECWSYSYNLELSQPAAHLNPWR